MPKSALNLLLLDPPIPYEGILMGVDFGLRRIGLATGQTFTQQAHPLTIISAEKGIPNWVNFDAAIKTWQPLALIIGIPLNMDDTAQPLTYKARHFGWALKKRYQLPVHGMDERLTSFAVRQALFEQGGYRAIQKNAVDALAAKIILEEWMQCYCSA